MGEGIPPAIQTVELTKRYSPLVLALDSLTLTVQRGEIFGFLGPNGAGKTTTIRLLLDLIRPTAGAAYIFGLDCQSRSLEARRRVGYLPGELNLYGNTPRRLLDLFGSLRGDAVSPTYVDEISQRLEIELDRSVRDMSHGNRQKVGLLLALMSRPDLLILDEPTAGLDPLMQHRVLDILRDARAEGRTVFFSSHVLSEVEQICDRVGFIRQGRLIAVEAISSLQQLRVQRLRITFSGSAPVESFASVLGVQVLTRDGDSLLLEIKGDVDAVVKAAAAYHVVSIEAERPTLEEVFMAYYEAEKTPAREQRHA